MITISDLSGRVIIGFWIWIIHRFFESFWISCFTSNTLALFLQICPNNNKKKGFIATTSTLTATETV